MLYSNLRVSGLTKVYNYSVQLTSNATAAGSFARDGDCTAYVITVYAFCTHPSGEADVEVKSFDAASVLIKSNEELITVV